MLLLVVFCFLLRLKENEQTQRVLIEDRTSHLKKKRKKETNPAYLFCTGNLFNYTFLTEIDDKFGTDQTDCQFSI